MSHPYRRERPPSSFGRPPESPQDGLAAGGPLEQQVVLLPPLAMPPVQVPVVLVVDAESLLAAAQQIAGMVADAVRAGFDQGVAEHAGVAGRPVDVFGDSVLPEQLQDLP